MDDSFAIQATNLSKKYRLGTIGMTSLREDLSRLWNRGKNEIQKNASNQASIEHSRMINDSEFWALHELNFKIPQGEVVGLIGANGSGKSTLLKILSRITEPSAGEIKVRGKVASLLEVGTGFHPELTGRENVFINGAILGMTHREVDSKFDEIVEFADVSDFIDTPIKRYSSGMTVRLGFAVAAHLDPDIMIVDEVLAVGDAAFQKKCIGKMEDISNEGRTVIFVSHQLAMIENLCSKCMLLESGRLIDYNVTKSIVSKYCSNIFKNKINSLAERTDRVGTGEITVSDFKILNEDNKVIHSIRCGQKVTFLFNIIVNKNIKGNVTFSIGINDNKGNRITQLNSKTTRDQLAISDANCEIKLQIFNFNLLPGSYSFNIYIAINDAASDWIINADTITVLEADYYKSGILPSGKQGVLLMDYKYYLNN